MNIQLIYWQIIMILIHVSTERANKAVRRTTQDFSSSRGLMVDLWVCRSCSDSRLSRWQRNRSCSQEWQQWVPCIFLPPTTRLTWCSLRRGRIFVLGRGIALQLSLVCRLTGVQQQLQVLHLDFTRNQLRRYMQICPQDTWLSFTFSTSEEKNNCFRIKGYSALWE